MKNKEREKIIKEKEGNEDTWTSMFFLTHLIVVLTSYLADTDKDRQYFYDKINVIFNHFKSSSCQDDYHGLKR